MEFWVSIYIDQVEISHYRSLKVLRFWLAFGVANLRSKGRATINCLILELKIGDEGIGYLR
jgi:hypothetical protein